VPNNPWRPAQHDFAHKHPVTNIRVIDCGGHIGSNGRPAYGVALRVNDGRLSRVVVTRWRNVRRRSEHKVIRIRRVRHDRTGSVRRGRLSRRCAGYRVRCCSRCRSLRERCRHRCRTSQSNCQHFNYSRLFHICLSALIEWMLSIEYFSGSLAPDLFQLCPDIVNCASHGRIRLGNSFCCTNLR